MGLSSNTNDDSILDYMIELRWKPPRDRASSVFFLFKKKYRERARRVRWENRSLEDIFNRGITTTISIDRSRQNHKSTQKDTWITALDEWWKIRMLLARGGGVLPYRGYIGMCRCEGYPWDLDPLWERLGWSNKQLTDHTSNRLIRLLSHLNWD